MENNSTSILDIFLKLLQFFLISVNFYSIFFNIFTFMVDRMILCSIIIVLFLVRFYIFRAVTTIVFRNIGLLGKEWLI